MAKIAIDNKKGINLATVVNKVKPTILIGTSTQPSRFTQEIVCDMASSTQRPIIFPLSNPTLLHEATLAHLIEWTDGKVLVATGAPFDDVVYNGVTYKIGQANNAALYPGLGLGAIVSKVSKITDEMIYSAAQAVASQADLIGEGASLLSSNKNLRITSSVVAVEVMKVAKQQGVCKNDSTDSEVEIVRKTVWWPTYTSIKAI